MNTWCKKISLTARHMAFVLTALCGSLAMADVAQSPLFASSTATPLMMLTMSRDEQLFNKAYPDYTDMDGDGKLDTTYQDNFDYSGYFDPVLCYSYGSGRFKAAATATDLNGNGKAHECGTGTGNTTQWSGNFLNWVTMSRIDVLRFVLYGGNRSTDTATQTILERAHIPNDLHAWAKVYSGTDVNSYAPFTGAQSFCNASFSTTGDPLIRRAPGQLTEWAATDPQQCLWRTGSDTNQPYDPGTSSEFVARVEVCDPTAGAVRESFCKLYGTSSRKPVGLLQDYGEPQGGGNEGRMRFGLLSGSYSNPRSGGVLRRNIGRLAVNSGTSCVAGDEINLSDGTFCNQASGNEGVINTIRQFKLTQWSPSNWADCNTYGILNRQGTTNLANPGTSTAANRKCSAWGNPISEMYAETLRYLSGVADTSKTAGFNAGTDLAGLPSATWRNPYGTAVTASGTNAGGGGNPYCASCNVLVLSSGLPSFDGDEVPTVAALGATADAATNDVGVLELINGQYLAGRSMNHLATGQAQPNAALGVGDSANTHEDLCQSRTVDDLSKVRGLCPDIPAQEGSMLIAGLAFKARTTDLQSTLTGKPADHKITTNTYTVALAESLPKFEIPVDGKKILLAPLGQANNSGTAVATDTGWRSSFLGSVSIGPKTSLAGVKYTYGRALEADQSAGSFSLVWEDSQWGNDHDNDVVTMITYCVGSKCDKTTTGLNGTGTSYTDAYSGKDICWRSNSAVCGAAGNPTVAADEVLIRIENLSAYAGNAMLTGFAVTGSDADGLVRNSLRPGNSNNSLLTAVENPPANWARPQVLKYKAGTSTVKQLEDPLWYAAKYGAFVTLDKTKDLTPQAQGTSSWNKLNKTPAVPDAYFKVTDPSKLKASLDAVFSDVLTRDGSASAVATNSTRLDAGTTVYQAAFLGKGWSGVLRAYALNETTGAVQSLSWDTDGVGGGGIPAVGSRSLFTYDPVGGVGTTLSWAGLNATQKLALQETTESTDANAQLRLNWLRGDRTVEDGALLRVRDKLLGDIVNSDPVFSSTQNFRYDQLPTGTPGQSTYKTYVASKSSRTPVVYVGANDGFLHAFNANTGRELFAYMPSAALAKAIALTRPDYGQGTNPHQYFVDGPMFVGDAYISSRGGWRTILVGSTGGGSKSIFALDVTDPSSFSASDVLFELNVADHPELGNVLGQPLINRMADGRWAAVFGNGYNSASALAYLFVVDLADPSSVVKIQAGASGSNGLSGPSVMAVNGTVESVFAGDLQGSMWKFDLSSTSPSSWEVAYGTSGSPLPLFQARGPSGEVQPITTAPTLGRNPQRGNALMVYFGTGQYFATNDNVVSATPPVQSFYGILDGTAITVTNRSVLHQKIISSQVATTSRTVTEGSINWASVSGWYMNLLDAGISIGTGERVITKPILVYDRLIFTTFIPSTLVCDGGGSGWLMEVGGVGDDSATFRIFDNDGKYLEVAVLKVSALIKGGDSVYLPLSDIKGNISTEKGNHPEGGRLSWRQLR